MKTFGQANSGPGLDDSGQAMLYPAAEAPLIAPGTPKTAEFSLIARVVSFSADRAWLVALMGFGLGALALAFAATHFSMSTNTDELISRKLPYIQRDMAFGKLFQPEGDQIVTVVDGVTPELAEEAAASLTAKLAARPDLFHNVSRPDGESFFQRNGLLFEPIADVRSDLGQLIAAQPFLGPLAADPSLRGLMGSLSTALQGVTTKQASLSELNRPIVAVTTALDTLRSGRPAYFSWRALISGKGADPRLLRHVILATPIIDFSRLQPGADASGFIRRTAAGLGLDAAHGVRVRLTGPIPLADDELGTLADRALLIACLSLGAILVMLWLAVRSARLIGAIMITMLIGLVTAAACGLLVFHRFNVISVAFIPLFVGLGIDFGIQFTVRYQSERPVGTSTRVALVASGAGMGRSLALAATAIAAGFLAFAPTAYVGVSQLGVIAGLGMFIALGLNLTVLPALISLFQPPAMHRGAVKNRLERLDAFILGHRWRVVGVAVGAALICVLLLPKLQFDFNPLHLKNAKAESVSTLLDLMRDPDQSPNTLEIIAPSLTQADLIARRMEHLPEVSEARTLDSFVPDDQAEKLAAIGDAAMLLDLTLNPIVVAPPPTDTEVITALRQTAGDLRTAAPLGAGSAASNARALANDLDGLAAAPLAMRTRAAAVLMPGLTTVLDQTRNALQAAPVTVKDLPPDIRRDWLAPDGRARVSLVPRGDSNNNAVLTRFIAVVTRFYPDATGAPIGIQMGGKTVANAFLEAGVLSFIAITLLLFAVLRRVRDVAITMAPIVLTGLLTLGTCVIIGQPLNFANIIALPLLFGIGVAFHIYFVMAWRSGGSHLLQSSLTRAVFFSALATATGFGSLWASSHPGTASMGLLLMISLVWTLVSALIFQPALMGPPPADHPA
jgi:hopanoid biosynthesis associated RND transporter like protein HpnN